MFETMHAANGAGLAAPQIGVPLRVVIFGYADRRCATRAIRTRSVPQTILVNPVLEPAEPTKSRTAGGCLSVPGLRGVVPRVRKLRYAASTSKEDDRAHRRGFHARVVQHE